MNGNGDSPTARLQHARFILNTAMSLVPYVVAMTDAGEPALATCITHCINIITERARELTND